MEKLIAENSTGDKSIAEKGSPSGMIAGFFFATIGFIAFAYGKKNTKFQPMIIGIVLVGIIMGFATVWQEHVKFV